MHAETRRLHAVLAIAECRLVNHPAMRSIILITLK